MLEISKERKVIYEQIYKDACKYFIKKMRDNGFTCSYFSIDVKGVKDSIDS